MKKLVLGVTAAFLLMFGAALVGCHADPDDAKGQAKELSDPARRQYALNNIQRLFNSLLVRIKNDRSNKEYKDFVDATIQPLVQTYLDHPEDSQNRAGILSLLKEMRDNRALPALSKALEWRAEVNEDQAISAAQTIQYIEIPAEKRAEIVSALCAALGRIDGARGLDNRMRKAFIETLGKLKDKAATPTLVKIMLTQSETQNFLFNILAAQQLIGVADPTATPALIKALYIFDAKNPQMRANDVATSALIAIGKPALPPLLDLLKGNNQEANQIVENYIQVIKQRDPEFAAKMNAKGLVSVEASYALGKLGYRDALDPIIEETKAEDENARFGAAIALVSINRNDGDTPRILEAMKQVYEKIEPIKRPQLLVAMRHLYASEVMPFFLNVLKTYEYEISPIRIYSYEGYEMLADKTEVANLRTIVNKSSDAFKENIKDHIPLLAVAESCDRDIACYQGKLGDKEPFVLRKAINTIARFGRGNPKAVDALIPLLSHRELEVRNEALAAIDYIAVNGSKAAVEAIDQLQAREEGRSVWNNFKREALPTRSRLASRTSG
jgi:HEAT repeat protein